MPFDLPEIPHSRIGAKCLGTIMPRESQNQGQRTITFQCNACGQVLGALDAALARALALELDNGLVISRMDEKDPAAKVLTGISEECRVHQCDRCPGMFFPEQTLGEPVFCTHVCHKVLSAGGVSAVS